MREELYSALVSVYLPVLGGITHDQESDTLWEPQAFLGLCEDLIVFSLTGPQWVPRSGLRLTLTFPFIWPEGVIGSLLEVSKSLALLGCTSHSGGL